ncbi:MAG: RNA polymerase sporulation sigma factor SigK [Lawsonibacter sp.]|nr:RNA polymerase sporulation sigma factor SigK [Lawsonibacter sp.]
MLSPVICLMMNALFFSLRLSGGTGSFPRPLKPAEEQEYLERCAAGDLEARNVLVEHNLRLVAHIVKKYYAQTGDQDDLISIGTIGLIKGISTFKTDKNVRLATYASRCIENEILMHFRAQKKLAGEVSLADNLDPGDESGSLSLMDVIAVDDNMLEELDNKESCKKVRLCVERCLTPRERTIITMRYGLDDSPPRTQREIAQRCGISRSYVSRIEKRALGKLEEAMDEKGDGVCRERRASRSAAPGCCEKKLGKKPAK